MLTTAFPIFIWKLLFKFSQIRRNIALSEVLHVCSCTILSASCNYHCKNDSKYCDIEITEAKIYAIKSRSLIDFNIGESRLATQKEEIQNTADLINSHEFNKNESSYCNICEFLKYCNG